MFVDFGTAATSEHSESLSQQQPWKRSELQLLKKTPHPSMDVEVFIIAFLPGTSLQPTNM